MKIGISGLPRLSFLGGEILSGNSLRPKYHTGNYRAIFEVDDFGIASFRIPTSKPVENGHVGAQLEYFYSPTLAFQRYSRTYLAAPLLFLARIFLDVEIT